MVTKAQEFISEQAAEKRLRSQRELPNGRDFKCFKQRERTDFGPEFEKRFYDTFPDAPGSKAWFDKKFRGRKGKKGLKTGYYSGGFLG